MASTYSPLLRLELIAAGEQAGLWGNTTNGNLGALLEQAIAGTTFIALPSAIDYTLSSFNGATDEARAAVLVVTGSPGATTNIVVPTLQKTYIVKNSTASTIVVKCSAQVGGVNIVTGGAMIVFCDGTSVFAAVSKIDVGELLQILPVANGGTGSATATGSGAVVLAASPALTGNPTAPTQTFGDASSRLANTAFVQAAIATGAGAAVPVGSIFMWPTASPPTNYVLCNGQTLSRTTSATLFGIIGTTFGGGDGTTTFNVPNYLNRSPVGAGNTYPTAGLVGGNKDSFAIAHNHTVSSSGSTSGESALHTHGVSDPGHAHAYSLAISAGNQKPLSNGTAPFDAYQAASTTADGTGISLGTQTVGHTHTVTVSGTTSTAGSSGVGANLPPFISMFFIMKAA